MATHLYRIAQEAVGNAIKHGHARHIVICLKTAPPRTILTIQDDGLGLPAVPPKPKGMGLRIMQYRAGVCGGSLAVQPGSRGGTSVVCSLSTPNLPFPP